MSARGQWERVRVDAYFGVVNMGVWGRGPEGPWEGGMNMRRVCYAGLARGPQRCVFACARAFAVFCRAAAAAGGGGGVGAGGGARGSRRRVCPFACARTFARVRVCGEGGAHEGLEGGVGHKEVRVHPHRVAPHLTTPPPPTPHPHPASTNTRTHARTQSHTTAPAARGRRRPSPSRPRHTRSRRARPNDPASGSRSNEGRADGDKVCVWGGGRGGGAAAYAGVSCVCVWGGAAHKRAGRASHSPQAAAPPSAPRRPPRQSRAR